MWRDVTYLTRGGFSMVRQQLDARGLESVCDLLEYDGRGRAGQQVQGHAIRVVIDRFDRVSGLEENELGLHADEKLSPDSFRVAE